MEPENHDAAGMTQTQVVVAIVVTIAALVVLAGLSAPVILKSRRAPDRTESLNNIKQIGMMLFEFDN